MSDFLKLLIENAIQNGEISDTDYKIIKKKAAELGISTEELNKLIEQIKNKQQNKPDASETELGSGFIVDEQEQNNDTPQIEHQPIFTDIKKIDSSGAMSDIYTAKRYGKLIIIKRIKDKFKDDPQYQKMFLKEFEIAYSLDHPNIVKVLDKGKDKDGLFFTMEYIDGRPLRNLIDKNGIENQKLAIRIAKQLLETLSYLHKKQIYHRDLKPENILITYNGDNVKILDFGLSNADSFQDNLKAAGTNLYAAPEQLTHASKADQRADLYSVGKILLEMFTGSPDIKNISKIKNKKLQQIIIKATQANPQLRYHDADQMLEDLNKITIETQLTPHHTVEKTKNKKLIIPAVILIVITAIIAVAVIFFNRSNGKTKEELKILKTADSLYTTGYWSKALEIYKQIDEKDNSIKNKIKILTIAVDSLNKANELFNKKNIAGAKKILQQILKKYPNFTEAKEKLSQCQTLIKNSDLNSLTIVKNSATEKFGLQDQEGNLIVDYQFDEIAPKKDWHKRGIIPVRCGNFWGFLDKNKNLFAPCQYKHPLNGKYIWIQKGFKVQLNGKNVIITTDNQGNGIIK